MPNAHSTARTKSTRHEHPPLLRDGLTGWWVHQRKLLRSSITTTRQSVSVCFIRLIVVTRIHFFQHASASRSAALSDMMGCLNFGSILPKLVPRSVQRACLAGKGTADARFTFIPRLIINPKPPAGRGLGLRISGLAEEYRCREWNGHNQPAGPWYFPAR